MRTPARWASCSHGRRRSDDATRSLVSGLNYIFKSLDLIPDGIDDLGFLDDAFVLRVACAFAGGAQTGRQARASSQRLSDDARAVKDFLGDDYPRLETYVKGLRKGAARGRTVEDIVTDAGRAASFSRRSGRGRRPTRCRTSRATRRRS